MERAEKIGLGVAAAGHVVLFGLLSMSLIWSKDTVKLGNTEMGVTIVGETGSSIEFADNPLPIAEPEIIEEFPDELSEQEPEDSSPPDSPREVEPPSTNRNAEIRRQREIEQRRAREREAATKRAAEERRRRIAETQRQLANAGNSANSGPPSKSAGQVRGEVRALIGQQVKPYTRGCTPSGIDVNKIVTRVTLRLNRNGSLAGMSGIRQSGLNDNNRPQAKTLENCIVSAIRKASPFSGLDPDYFDVWQNHKMAFQG